MILLGIKLPNVLSNWKLKQNIIGTEDLIFILNTKNSKQYLQVYTMSYNMVYINQNVNIEQIILNDTIISTPYPSLHIKFRLPNSNFVTQINNQSSINITVETIDREGIFVNNTLSYLMDDITFYNPNDYVELEFNIIHSANTNLNSILNHILSGFEQYLIHNKLFNQFSFYMSREYYTIILWGQEIYSNILSGIQTFKLYSKFTYNYTFFDWISLFGYCKLNGDEFVSKYNNILQHYNSGDISFLNIQLYKENNVEYLSMNFGDIETVIFQYIPHSQYGVFIKKLFDKYNMKFKLFENAIEYTSGYIYMDSLPDFGNIPEFIDLQDTPNSYTGAQNKVVKVSQTEDKLIFDELRYRDLTDVDGNYIGKGGRLVSVRDDETGLTFINIVDGGDL